MLNHIACVFIATCVDETKKGVVCYLCWTLETTDGIMEEDFRYFGHGFTNEAQIGSESMEVFASVSEDSITWIGMGYASNLATLCRGATGPCYMY